MGIRGIKYPSQNKESIHALKVVVYQKTEINKYSYSWSAL